MEYKKKIVDFHFWENLITIIFVISFINGIRSYIQDSQEMKETDTIQDLWNYWGEEDVKLLEFLKYFGNSKLKVESLERIVRQLPVLETDRKLCLEEKKR